MLAPSGPTLTPLEIEPRHVDPANVLWATMKLIDVDKIPPQTTVVRFALRDRPAAGYWLILRRPQPELSTRPGGYTEDIVCRTDSRTLIDLHLKRLAIAPPSWKAVSTRSAHRGSPTSSRAGFAPARSPTSSPSTQWPELVMS